MKALRVLFAMIAMIAVVSVSYVLPANGAEKYLGVIISTASVAHSNVSTATPFSIPSSAKISVQCDVATYVVVSPGAFLNDAGTTFGTPATATNGVKVTADTLFLTTTMPAPDRLGYLSTLSVSGTSNCKVFVRQGDEA